MKIPSSRTAITSTVSALSDDQLLEQTGRLARLDHQVHVFVIDHLVEIDARGLYLDRGFSSLFDYVKSGLGYSDAATWRRINAMKLCTRIEGVRERLWDGSLTLDAAAQLQHAFERRDRSERRDRERVLEVGGAGAAERPAQRPNGSAPAPEPDTKPTLDVSAQKALVERAAGKSTREVAKMLAEVDPALAAPADRVRPLGEGRWELKAVIDVECERGLEQLRGLLSHVDPRMTLGQLVGRLVREGLERHDPTRPPRRGRIPKASAADDRPPAAKRKECAGSSPANVRRNADRRATSAPKRPADLPSSAPKEHLRAARTIPAAVRRDWQRDGGRWRSVDPCTGRRCPARHYLQVDRVFPYALGGSAEPENPQLLCYAHPRDRHAERTLRRGPPGSAPRGRYRNAWRLRSPLENGGSRPGSQAWAGPISRAVCAWPASSTVAQTHGTIRNGGRRGFLDRRR